MSFWRIPAGINFAEAVAAELLQRARESTNPLELTDTLLLLPTRRACRTMRTAFLRQSDGQSLLLPRLYALGDLDADELMLTDADLKIPPQLPPMRRLLHLARLIRSNNAEWTHAQSISMARSLAKLLDDMTLEGISTDKLDTLLNDESGDLSEHWNQTLSFLSPVLQSWPQILQIEGALDAPYRLNMLIEAQIAAWTKIPPNYPVIVAGSQGTVPALARFIKLVADLPKGEVILPSLPSSTEAVSFASSLDATHPFYALNQLLSSSSLEIGHPKIKPWPTHQCEAATSDRRHLLHLALLPALSTNIWSALTPNDVDRIKNGAEGLVQIECQNEQEEAEVIATLLRKSLEDGQGKTAMLVTPSRDLGRRVAAELERWDLHISDSSGTPLAKTPPAMFLRALLDYAVMPTPSRLLAVLKHPLAGTGISTLDCRRYARQLELQVLRGLPASAMQGIDSLITLLSSENPLASWLMGIQAHLSQLLQLLNSPAEHNITLIELTETLVKCAERLCQTDDRDGATRLWAGEAGRALAEWVADIITITSDYTPLPVIEAPPALLALMMGVNIHLNQGQHPRLSILGPLEAQLQQADLVILGSLNEGTWPAPPEPDPWMSRPMRRKLGLKPAEERIGQQAHDFYSLACAPEVVLTRSARNAGTPTVPARWWQRLDVLFKAANLDNPSRRGQDYLTLATMLDDTGGIHIPAPQPQPCPPATARPRAYAVTDLEKLQRDPYTVYARKLLKLKLLEPLEPDLTAAHIGNLYHDIAGNFVRQQSPEILNDRQKAISLFLQIAIEQLAQHHLSEQLSTLWPSIEKLADIFISLEIEHKSLIAQKGIQEQWGTAEISTTSGKIQLSAKADRIDILPDGSLVIIDYKSGTVPNAHDRLNGLSLQLPLEAVIAKYGQYNGLPKITKTTKLQHWPLKGNDRKAKDFEISSNKKILELDELINNSEKIMHTLISTYLTDGAPYTAEPDPHIAPAYNDYRQLSRYEEWRHNRLGPIDQDLIDILTQEEIQSEQSEDEDAA